MCARIFMHFPPERLGGLADQYDAAAFCQDLGVELGNLHAFERRTAGVSRLDGVFIDLRAVHGDDEVPEALRDLVEIALQNVRARGSWALRAASARARCRAACCGASPTTTSRR